MRHRQLILSALQRGVRKRCPHCGIGRLYSGWGNPIDRCSHCGLVYERNPGDTWFFTIIGDRLPVAVVIIVVYFNLGALSRALAAIVFAAMIAAIIWTAPNRWGVGIALHYVSRVFFPDPSDPVPRA